MSGPDWPETSLNFLIWPANRPNWPTVFHPILHLLDHADELREGPVQLVQDAIEEGGGHIFVHTQQLCHVSLQQQWRTRLWTNQMTGRGEWGELRRHYINQTAADHDSAYFRWRTACGHRAHPIKTTHCKMLRCHFSWEMQTQQKMSHDASLHYDF